ncbi:MAG: MarR family winged helix-turn-helix transcriptional regulator [Oligoflexus sp.]
MSSSLPTQTDPHLDRQALDFYDALNQLLRIYQFRDRDRICCYDISVTQCTALEVLIEKGALRLQSLAEQLFLDKSTTSRVIETLVRKGYVSRIPDPEDGRAVLIEISQSGHDLFQKIHKDLVAEQKEMIAELSPEVRSGATELLRKLANAANKRLRRDEICSVNKVSCSTDRGC